jgi:hypothetical protein
MFAGVYETLLKRIAGVVAYSFWTPAIAWR